MIKKREKTKILRVITKSPTNQFLFLNKVSKIMKLTHFNQNP